MSNLEHEDEDYVYDDEGNELCVRLPYPGEQVPQRSGPIRPVTSADLQLSRQREAERRAAEQAKKRRERLEEEEKQAELRRQEAEELFERTRKISPVGASRRAWQLDETPTES